MYKFVAHGKSLMNSRNKSGPKIEPHKIVYYPHVKTLFKVIPGGIQS